MTLQGFYTNLGQALAAKVAAGSTALTITRVVAGSGHTADPASATSLPDVKQTLAVGSPSISGSTATIPVTLAEVQAGTSYSLTELGIYATDPDAGEILFQIYQLDTSAPITAGGEGVLRFYLRQTIGAQGVTVTCSPAGLLMDADIAELRSAVMQTFLPKITDRIALSELQEYLDSLPRLLAENHELSIYGSWTGELHLSGFYGGGTLTLLAESGCTLTGRILMQNSRINLEVCRLTINSGAQTAGDNGLIRAKICCGQVYLRDCVLTGNKTTRGVDSDMATVIFDGGTIQNCYAAIFTDTNGRAFVDVGSGFSFSGNTYGGWVRNGGMIQLCGSVPQLLGGSSNIKSGGIIITASGSLL